MREGEYSEGRNAFLYDAERIGPRELFALFVKSPVVNTDLPSGGRGKVRIVNHDGQDYVIRHYRRGGTLAHLTGDRYVWNGFSRSRPWREWRLLAELHTQGLPVPRPLATRLTRAGLFYRADLATVRLPADGSLGELVRSGPLAETVWQQVGQVIWAFHACGVCHADLNAHNILLTRDGADIWLLDFDKARRRSLASGWQQANLDRLKRSLDKLLGTHAQAHFGPHQWHCLFGAYSKASNANRSPHNADSRST